MSNRNMQTSSSFTTKGMLRHLGAAILVAAITSMYGCGGDGGDSPDTNTASPVDKYANVPTPALTSLPIGTIGAADHNYPWFSPDYSLSVNGYIQQEFIMEGKANQYNMPAPQGGVGNQSVGTTPTGTIVSKDNPYRTRIHVIRPTDPAKFNGKVIVEWQNVSSGYDTPVLWLQLKDMAMRNGYAWVGISAQSNGITKAVTGLKAWSPSRYGSLDVTNGGKFSADELGYDIFAQGAKAIRSIPAVLGGLSATRLIAVGASQSAGRLGFYLNSVEPLANIFDAALLTVGGPELRTDLHLPIIKVLSETEMVTGGAMGTNELQRLQADTSMLKTWFVPGSVHADNYGLTARASILWRDAGIVMSDTCASNTRSRIPSHYVYRSAVDRLVQYLDKGTPIPTSPSVNILSATTPSIAKDSYGNAVGGIRLPEMEAPTAVANGGNPGAGTCFLTGSWIPFDKATMDALYPTHDSYVKKYATAANAAVAAGFLLAEDAQEGLAKVQSSVVGYQLNCGSMCADVAQFANNPTIGNMQWFPFAYNIPDRAKLLAPLDDAALSIALGDTNTDPTAARNSFNRAIGSLQTYIAQLNEQLQKQTITQDAANFLKSQAVTLIASLGKS